MAAETPKSNNNNNNHGNRRLRNRRRGGGDAEQSLDESNSEQQGSVSESSTSTQSSTFSDAPRRVPDGEELMSKTLIIQNKRFYVDVRENPSGRFVKLAEVLPDGRKTRLSLTMRVARELRNHLTQFSEFYASLGPAAPASAPAEKSPAAARPESDAVAESDSPKSLPEGSSASVARTPPLKSAVIYTSSGKAATAGKRRYYIDLKENRRGRFLQISEAAQKDGYTQRYRVAIPAQGLVETRDCLSGILREFGPSESSQSDTPSASKKGGKGVVVTAAAAVRSVGGGEDADLPIAKSMRVHPGKVIYFDPGTNPRGNFVKISQVTTRFRTSILLPTETLAKVGEILNELQKGFDGGKSDGSTPSPKAKKRSSKPRAKSSSSSSPSSSKPAPAVAAAPVKTLMAAA